MEELAHTEGKKRPRAFLDWVTALEEEGKPRQVLTAAQDALETLPANVWQDALSANIGLGYWAETSQEENYLLKRVERAYAEVIAHASLSLDEQDEFLSWCLRVARRRADTIVKDQHRKSYGKAAALMAACAEVLRLRAQSAEADALLNQVRNCFPRHRAFQSELERVCFRRKRNSSIMPDGTARKRKEPECTG